MYWLWPPGVSACVFMYVCMCWISLVLFWSLNLNPPKQTFDHSNFWHSQVNYWHTSFRMRWSGLFKLRVQMDNSVHQISFTFHQIIIKCVRIQVHKEKQFSFCVISGLTNILSVQMWHNPTFILIWVVYVLFEYICFLPVLSLTGELSRVQRKSIYLANENKLSM